MTWLPWLAAMLSAMFFMLVLRFLWAWLTLHRHPQVEPIEIAKPSIAENLNHLVADIATLAGVPPPSVYIRRAQLPNAFVVAAIGRPELYLTDEMLEYCNEIENGLDRLTFVICHEIAHLHNGDALSLGLLTYAIQWCLLLRLKRLGQYFQYQINVIERQADADAELLVRELKAHDSNNVTGNAYRS